MDLSELRRKAHQLQPTVRVGKAGINDAIIAEVEKQLEKKNLVKVKFLQSFSQLYDVREAAEQIAEKTSSRIVQKLGSVVVLYHG